MAAALPTLPSPARALRIAYITETWPPEVNGVAMSTQRFVEGLLARGHEVQLIRPRQRGEADPAPRGGLRQVLAAGLPIPMYPALRVGWARRHTLLRRWRAWRPDIVHMATEGPLAWAALRAANRLGLPTSSDYRTNFDAYSRCYGLGWLHPAVTAVLRDFHNRTRLTMVPTEALRGELQSAGFERLAVVARGVDTTLYHPGRRRDALRAHWGAGPADVVLACVGRLAAEKNLGQVIAAYEAVRQRQPRARLLLVGDGPLREVLRTRCPQALFTGQRSGEDLAAHYASADLFVFASQTETYGNVVPEAMASGLPVAAYRHAAAGQLIRPGVNGLLAACDDDAGFIAQTVALAGDAALRERLGRAARDTIATLGWAEVVRRFEGELLALAGPQPQAGPPCPAPVLSAPG